jgi:diguanylate cyclase (GGDEF)-like protein/PAS domain S-box-containing protein
MTPAATDAARLAGARVATLFRMTRPAYLGGAAAAGIIVFVLWEVVPVALLAGWFAAFIAIAVARLAAHAAYMRAPAGEAARALTWENRFALGSLASGAAWCFVPAAMFPSELLLQTAVVVVVGGVALAGTALCAASAKAVYGLVLLPMAALVMQLFLQNTPTHRVLAVTMAAFTGIMAVMSRELRRGIVENLRTRLDREALLARVEASETRLRDAIESFPEGIAVWDEGDRLLACNEAYARVYGHGRRAAQLIGSPFGEIVEHAWESEHPEADPAIATTARRAWIAQRVQLHREGLGAPHQYLGRDGRWRQGSTTRMRGGGWVGLVADITDLKRAQDAYMKVLAEEDLVLDTLPVGVAFVARREIVRCNRRLEQMLGYEAGELNGKSTRAWFSTAERWDEAADATYESLATGGIMEGDAHLRRKDGSGLWCRVLARALDPHAPRESAIFTFADVDQRVAAEKALRDSEERLRLAVDAAGLVYWEWDRETNQLRWEGRAQPWAEYRDRVHPDDRERYVAAAEAAWAQGTPYSAEYRVLDRDGRPVWISARGKAIRDAAGRAKRMIGVAQDVTERRQQEETVRFLAHHDTLTGLPNRRLLDDRLKQALYRAQRREGRVAVLLIDLDDFKQVNDSAGHRAGDAVLREVALRLGGCMRKADTLARHGGDEFVVVMGDLPGESDCQAVAEKVHRALAPEFRIDGKAFALGASIGIALYPGDAADSDALLRNADAAMYRAKQLGRNHYRFYGK